MLCLPMNDLCDFKHMEFIRVVLLVFEKHIDINLFMWVVLGMGRPSALKQQHKTFHCLSVKTVKCFMLFYVLSILNSSLLFHFHNSTFGVGNSFP